MKTSTRCIVLPRDGGKEQQEHEAEVQGYERAATKFATCHFGETIGMREEDSLIRFHDEATGASSHRPLA